MHPYAQCLGIVAWEVFSPSWVFIHMYDLYGSSALTQTRSSVFFLVSTEECILVKALTNVQTQTKKAKNKNLGILVETV